MKKLVLLCISMGLMACAQKIPLEAIPYEPPTQWQQGKATAWPSIDWWQQFESPELLRLQQVAQENNPELAAMAARLLQADYQLTLRGVSKFPTVDASLGGRHNGVLSGGNERNSWNADFGASYELDVWGRLYAQRQSAKAQWLATQFEQQAVALSVSAEVGRQYVALLALRERERIAEEQLATAKEVLRVVQARVRAGAVSPMDEMRQTAQLERQRAALHPLRQQRLEAELALANLLGVPAQAVTVEGEFAQLAAPTTEVGLSSELLLRRPDLRQQEARLQAAQADVKAARRALYPNFRLTAGVGQSGDTWSQLWRGSWMYNLGASVTQPIFQGGRLRAEHKLSQAQQLELLEDYRGALLSAFTEVEVALSNLDAIQAQYQAQQEVLATSQELFRLAERRYREGADDLLSLLEAQQSLYSAEETVLNLAEQALQAHITLYRVIGGGAEAQTLPMQKAS